MTSAKMVLAVLLTGLGLILTQWTTLSSIPNFDIGGATSFGGTVFAALGSWAYTMDTVSGDVFRNKCYDHRHHVEEVRHGLHLQLTNVWTYKNSLPLATNQVSGAYYDGAFVVSRYAWIHVYTVALDVWTTGASLPSDRDVLYGGVASIAGFVFVVGGFPTTGNDQKLERYDIANDVWTILDPVPKQSFTAVTAITSAGLLVAIGHSSLTWVHGYTTGLTAPPETPAGASSDPHMRAFSGHRFLLDARPGVYTLLTSPSLQINALFDLPPNAPPCWTSVMTHVAILLYLNGKHVRIMIDSTGKVTHDGDVTSAALVEQTFQFVINKDVLVSAGVGMRLTHAKFSLQVFPQHLMNGVQFDYLDVLIHPPSASLAPVHGILGQTSRASPATVKFPMCALLREIRDPWTYLEGKLSDYEVADGDLFGSPSRFAYFVDTE